MASLQDDISHSASLPGEPVGDIDKHVTVSPVVETLVKAELSRVQNLQNNQDFKSGTVHRFLIQKSGETSEPPVIIRLVRGVDGSVQIQPEENLRVVNTVPVDNLIPGGNSAPVDNQVTAGNTVPAGNLYPAISVGNTEPAGNPYTAISVGNPVISGDIASPHCSANVIQFKPLPDSSNLVNPPISKIIPQRVIRVGERIVGLNPSQIQHKIIPSIKRAEKIPEKQQGPTPSEPLPEKEQRKTEGISKSANNEENTSETDSLNIKPIVKKLLSGDNSVSISQKSETEAGEKEVPVGKRKLEKTVRISTYTGDYPHECTQCDKKFRFDHHLKRHRLIHTGERPHECDLCEKKFTRGEHLRRHRITHSGERPYNCKDCEKSFLRLYVMRKHIEKEHGITREMQMIEDRDLKAKEKSLKIAEKQKVKKEKENEEDGGKKKRRKKDKEVKQEGDDQKKQNANLRCSVCDKTFARSGNLLRHLKIHADSIDDMVEENYEDDEDNETDNEKTESKESRNQKSDLQCSVCDKTFARSGNLLRHLKIHADTIDDEEEANYRENEDKETDNGTSDSKQSKKSKYVPNIICFEPIKHKSVLDDDDSKVKEEADNDEADDVSS